MFSLLMFVAGCICGAFMYAVYKCRPRHNTKVGTPSASHNSTRNAIAQVRESARRTLGKPATYTAFVAHLDWLEQQHP